MSPRVTPTHATAPSAQDAHTRDRLLAVAGETFAELGFRGTTIREVCKRAGVNVASVHYHFGSKKDLYLAALREALEAVKNRGALPDAPRDRAALPRYLEAFVRTAVERVLSGRPDWHQTLLQREFVDPSFALDVVVREYIRPHFRSLRDALALALPDAEPRTIDLHALSIIGQVVYYRAAGPIALRLLGAKSVDGRLCDELAEHIARFSTRALGVRP